MAYKLIDAARSRWRAVDAPQLVTLVRAGRVFVNCKLVERPEAPIPKQPERAAGMDATRVVLIGGTSYVGKSTVARIVAEQLGFAYRSTDKLARHPGRPWPTSGREVPAHVDQHYRSHDIDELIASVLDHYKRLWPGTEALITRRAAADPPCKGLVLEGSALWPTWMATLTAPRNTSVLADRRRAGAARPHAYRLPLRPSHTNATPPDRQVPGPQPPLPSADVRCREGSGTESLDTGEYSIA